MITCCTGELVSNHSVPTKTAGDGQGQKSKGEKKMRTDEVKMKRKNINTRK